MEDPSRRDRLSNVHLRKTHENAAKLKASWASPVKYDGFWRSETMTNSYNHNLKNRRDVNVGACPLAISLLLQIALSHMILDWFHRYHHVS